MPGVVRYAVASAAHNLASTWNGGASVPSAGDTVYLNNFTVTGYAADFDLATGAPDVNAGSFVTGVFYVIKTVGSTSWTSIGASSNTVGVGFFATGPGSGSGVATAVGCLTNRSLASPAITGGGTFQAGDGRTLRATTYGPDGAVTAAPVNYTGYTSTTVIGDVYPTVSGGTIRVTGAACYGTLTVNGNLKPQQGGTGAGCCISIQTGSASVVLNGNIEPPSASTGIGLSVVNGFNVTVNGTITGGTANAASGLSIACTGLLTVMGPLVGGSPTAPVITGGSAATGSYGIVFSGSTMIGSAVIGSPSLPATITGGSAASCHAIATANSAMPLVTVYGNIAGGAVGSGFVVSTGSGSYTFYGNAAGGTGGNGISVTGSVVATVNGNLTGSSTGAAHALVLSGSSIGIVNGNVTGGAFAGAYGVSDTGSFFCQISGDVTSGSGSASHGVNVTSSYSVYVVNGTAYASNSTSGSVTAGIFISGNSTVYVNKVVGSNYGVNNTNIVPHFGVQTASSGVGRVFVRKTQQGIGNYHPLSGLCYRWTDDIAFSDEDILYNSSGVNYATLKHPYGNPSYVPPSPDKVRLGTSFAFGDYTGTLNVPSINSVRNGVLNDSGTGVACITASDLWSIPNTISATSNTILSVMQSSATAETTAALTTTY